MYNRRACPGPGVPKLCLVEYVGHSTWKIVMLFSKHSPEAPQEQHQMLL